MGANVSVDGLRIAAGATTIVDNVSFSIQPGEVLALIGESGSGKTTIGLALLGYVKSGCRVVSGSVALDGVDVLSLDEHGRRMLRGRDVAYIAQSAAASFNPARTLLDQVVEPVVGHGLMGRREAEKKAIDLFRELALPQPGSIGSRYPHEVSGGQLQRVMAAMALISEPRLIVFDEPTTALDVTTQIEVLASFRRAVRGRGVSAVYISHDLGVVSQMADRILVLRHGSVQEYGAASATIQAPSSEYTKRLIEASRLRVRAAGSASQGQEPLLTVSGLCAGYGRLVRGAPELRVLSEVDFTVLRGQAVGVIGESGSGKSTLAKCIAGLLRPASGSVSLDGRLLAPGLETREREDLRRVQIVFQHADTVLNPAHSVGAILDRPLRFFHGMGAQERSRRVRELLDLVRLPSSMVERSSSRLSGGQKQRVNLARALAAAPDLILCDEVTSALDPIVADAILDLIADLRRDTGISYVIITHDMNCVHSLCDKVVVMRGGEKVAEVARDDYRKGSLHPYYEKLSASVPQLRSGWLDEVLAASGRA